MQQQGDYGNGEGNDGDAVVYLIYAFRFATGFLRLQGGNAGARNLVGIGSGGLADESGAKELLDGLVGAIDGAFICQELRTGHGGFPNAGKSSLVNLITAARPKIGAYPFTTLHVNIGTLEYPEVYQKLRLADIPGLIDGASDNRGLGHKFLRHIERCKVLVIMLDMAGTDGRKPADDFKNLMRELELYSPELIEKTMIVAANKMDEPDAPKNLKAFLRKYPKLDVIPISCLSEEGIPRLKEEIYDMCKKSFSV